MLLLLLQVMQNNHIASVTLYGAPRPSSLARAEPSAHWGIRHAHGARPALQSLWPDQ